MGPTEADAVRVVRGGGWNDSAHGVRAAYRHVILSNFHNEFLGFRSACSGRRREEHMQWLYLGTAIVAEVIATSVLKASEGFTRLIPSLVVLVGYATAFYFLSLTLRTIPLGIAYAIWSAVGIALVSVIGWLLYRQSLDAPAMIGIGLIVAGVAVIHGFSKSVAH
jgi:small multidrug resistance pump